MVDRTAGNDKCGVYQRKQHVKIVDAFERHSADPLHRHPSVLVPWYHCKYAFRSKFKVRGQLGGIASRCRKHEPSQLHGSSVKQTMRAARELQSQNVLHALTLAQFLFIQCVTVLGILPPLSLSHSRSTSPPLRPPPSPLSKTKLKRLNQSFNFSARHFIICSVIQSIKQLRREVFVGRH